MCIYIVRVRVSVDLFLEDFINAEQILTNYLTIFMPSENYDNRQTVTGWILNTYVHILIKHAHPYSALRT